MMSLEQKTNTELDHIHGIMWQEPGNGLAREYERWTGLLKAQPKLIQQFFEAQARNLADALIQAASQAVFHLPDRIIVSVADNREIAVPSEFREQVVGGLVDRLKRVDLNNALRRSLYDLEAEPNEAVAISAGLTRYATAVLMVHDLLPAGRAVRYQTAEGDEIPSLPVADHRITGSAFMPESVGIAENGNGSRGQKRGRLLVPYVPAALHFYLPQWVAFDDEDRLLVSSTNDAEACLTSMQRFVRILHAAVGLASYMVVDEQYQQKRYGMLGQLVNQGRAMARFQTRQIIHTIRRRAAANNLNRGLSISLPYFDDQVLTMRTLEFDVIPASRVLFIPAFVVLAVRKEQAKVAQDTRLSRSTRSHLLAELQMLEFAFYKAGEERISG